MGTVVGIVVAAVSVVILVLGILWWKCCLQRKNGMDLGIHISDVHRSSRTNNNHAEFQLCYSPVLYMHDYMH